MYFTLLVTFASTIIAALAAPMPSPFRHHRLQMSKRQDAAAPKVVVAHHMVGNTYPYTQDDWAADIADAHTAGIDAFALNIGTDSWQPDQVASAYAAAAASGTDFKMFISFDMTVLPCGSPEAAQTLRNYITKYASHPGQLKHNGRVFASTFAGENCNFGQGSAIEGWKTQFVQHGELTGDNAVHFVPSFFVDPATFGQYSGAMHGAFNWNSGWPIELTTPAANSIISSIGGSLLSKASSSISTTISALAKFVGATDTDSQYVNGLKNLETDNGPTTYMGAVSPWFFTHYGADSFNKNFLYYTGSHLYASRWDSIVKNRDMFNMIEIITWNDYGESHYIGPVRGAQPNSQAWVDGFDHTAFLQMTNYYATAYKTGQYPAIKDDKIFMWARTHLKDANSPDPIGRPTNAEVEQDMLWATVHASQPGKVTLFTSDSTSETFEVKAGVTKLMTPLVPGGYMRATFERSGQTLIDFRPEGYAFTDSPAHYNYNAFAAFATSAQGSPSTDPTPPPPPTDNGNAPPTSSDVTTTTTAESNPATPSPA